MAAVMVQQAENGWVVETVAWPTAPRRFVAKDPSEALDYAKTLITALVDQNFCSTPPASAERP